MAACHGSPTAPPPPPPLGLTLNGKILTAGVGSTGISGATVTVADGPDAGKSATTSGSGSYVLAGLQQASFSITASATGFVTESMKVTAGPNQLAVTILEDTALAVSVYDALLEGDTYRQVAGATVQLLDGAQAGASAITDANGTARFTGVFGAPVRVSVRKDGYYPLETVAPVNRGGLTPGTGWTAFELKAPDLVQLTPGKYSVTVATDGSCSNIPSDLQTRTYSATLGPLTGAQAGDGYTLTLDSLRGVTLYLTVSGHDVSITTGDSDPVSEPALRLAIFGYGIATVTTSPGLISLPFSYVFIYQNDDTCRGSNGLFTLASQ
jgi:hypothetical protein